MLFLKGSFEDEGLNIFEVQILSAMAAEFNTPLAFKVGGCEAKSDIQTALNYGASVVVAPMVESEFAVTKFISAVQPYSSFLDEININIETITAVENVSKILDKHHKNITGVVVGRTDLALSMGLSRKEVNSEEVMEQVELALTAAKGYNLTTTMGGSVNMESISCVINMANKNLLDRFETRKVIMKSSCSDKELELALRGAFEIETKFLERTLMRYENGQLLASNRIKAIKDRGN